MRWALITLSLIYCCCGYAQPTTLTILGRTSYTTYPDSYIYKISNAENGPSAADFDRLKFILDSLGVIYHLDSTGAKWSSFNEAASIDFYTSTLNHFELLKTESNKMRMFGLEDYKYAAESLIHQDSLALMAYHDALKRAKIMAQYLGKKITRVRNIDDNVKQYLFYLDFLPSLMCNIDLFDEILSFLELIYGNTEEPQAERSGQYALWVTFELK